VSGPSLPPEWAPQDGILLTWPHAHSDWAAALPEVEPVFVRLAQEITRREALVVVGYDPDHVSSIRSQLIAADIELSSVVFCVARSNDTWARDHGPITVYHDNKPCLLDFTFNGWGNKYPADLDNEISDHLTACEPFRVVDHETIDLVLEGGSIDTDGAGTLLTTVSCLLSPHRNPQLDRPALEAKLRRCLGVDRLLWLAHGFLEGDDTDGHVDMLARFADAATLVHAACDDPDDVHFESLSAMANALAAFRDADGNPYRLVALPLPKPKFSPAGKRLPASYVNFLIINQAVLVPAYDDPADDEAADRLQACFPDRQIVSIPSTPLIQQYGSLHCITMQLPEGVLTLQGGRQATG